MYVENLSLRNVRVFVSGKLDLIHPDMEFRSGRGEVSDSRILPRPRLPNVNLLLGDNASGKTTVLQAIALASLGPSSSDAQLPLRKFVRFRESDAPGGPGEMDRATIEADLVLHSEDGTAAGAHLRPCPSLIRRGELERLEYLDRTSGQTSTTHAPAWTPVFRSDNEAFFCVAYGATRRAEAGESRERGVIPKTPFVRAQRLQSIFQDSFGLYPLNYWLPELKSSDADRYAQLSDLFDRLLAPGHYRFTGEFREQDYLFERGGIPIPFRSMSDGYRAFIAWLADLLYHICYACPRGKAIRQLPGVVLVDEIDLLLHPKWQMQVIDAVAKALPRMQFVFTSHSPLVAGSLEWMNIWTLKSSAKTNRTTSKRLQQGIHGLDADQILVSRFFGLSTTKAPEKQRRLADITKRIEDGDPSAPLDLITELSEGTESDRSEGTEVDPGEGMEEGE